MQVATTYSITNLIGCEIGSAIYFNQVFPNYQTQNFGADSWNIAFTFTGQSGLCKCIITPNQPNLNCVYIFI